MASTLVTQGDRIVDPHENIVSPSMWTVTTTASAAAQAVATQAAGAAGVVHVCYGIVASIACGATAQTPINIQLVDGSTTILAAEVAAPVDGCAIVQLTNLHIPGTAATAMKLQFAAAGVAASIQSVTLIGYDIEG